MTKKAMVINMVKRNGFISLESAMNMTGWDSHNIHSSFRASALEKAGLKKVVVNGVKGFTFINNTRAVRTVLKQRKAMSIESLKELTGWDSHVLFSVFRKSNLDRLGLVRVENKLLVA